MSKVLVLVSETPTPEPLTGKLRSVYEENMFFKQDPGMFIEFDSNLHL